MTIFETCPFLFIAMTTENLQETQTVASAQSDVIEDAPLRVDVENNDFTPATPAQYSYTFSETDALLLAQAASAQIALSWIFSPKDTLDDDVRAQYAALQLAKKVNAVLPGAQRMGCVAEELLPFQGGDIYIDALYRIDTKLVGKAIAVARFSYNDDYIEFQLFDPVKYPNAKRLDDCLGDTVPLSDVMALEEVDKLTEQEKEDFSTAIKHAWANYY